MLLKAFDETFSAVVETRTSYIPDEVLWNTRFASAFMRGAADRFADSDHSGKKVGVDMRLFDKVEKVANTPPP